MIKINITQTLWLKQNFALTKKDFPKDFYEPKDIIQMLLGLHHFKGVEHYNSKCESLSFIEEAYLSMAASQANIKGFIKIFTQFDYLMKLLERKEYYELLSNFTTMMNCFLKAVDLKKNADFDYILFDLGFTKSGNSFSVPVI